MKYSDAVMEWLAEDGYTHCFFVAGGNIMHLLESARTRMRCVPFVHEVAAGIAAEYFNQVAPAHRAFALVTAGPGMTNIVTAMAGAFLESRELLVIGGQVKSTDLAHPGLRQRGIQEVDGLALARPVCVAVHRVERPRQRDEFMRWVELGRTPRKGPVFIEVCLDAQAVQVQNADGPTRAPQERDTDRGSGLAEQALLASEWLIRAERPVFLFGSGLSRDDVAELLPRLEEVGIPIATSWNGADLLDYEHALYFGRPNTWGMRWSNVLLQQADVVVAVGTRLGLQQTGFNWHQFAPLACVIHVDLDINEIEKGHPRVDLAVCADAKKFLSALLPLLDARRDEDFRQALVTWRSFGRDVQKLLPLCEPENRGDPAFMDPYSFVVQLSESTSGDDIIVPCSSGAAFTVMMQAFRQKQGQAIVTNKGLASMGYGLSGAIGAALGKPDSRVILVEGDGGFAQNLQELGTLAAQRLNVKIFLWDNEGYASIRMTQKNYFNGSYVGCDTATCLGLPDWETLFEAYSIPVVRTSPDSLEDVLTGEAFNRAGPAAFLVPIDPYQTYFPKIDSRVMATGGMESNPLHLMSPQLPDDVAASALRYLLMETTDE